MLIENSIASVIAYLFGSISSAVIVCKLLRIPDPRTHGSRNPGATNVLRIGGKKAGVLTLLGDMLKGVIPVLIAKYVGLTEVGIALVMFFAFMGHLYPIFFKFEGGKGVATAIGCFIAFNIYFGLAWVVTWLIVALIFRYASLAGIVASLFAPFYAWYFTHDYTYVLAVITMSAILMIRHHSNIANLLSGKENKIGPKK